MINRETADTNGILDRCTECGARARFTTDVSNGQHGAECTECANAVAFHATRDRAMVVWNQTQRHIRWRKARAGKDA